MHKNENILRTFIYYFVYIAYWSYVTLDVAECVSNFRFRPEQGEDQGTVSGSHLQTHTQ